MYLLKCFRNVCNSSLNKLKQLILSLDVGHRIQIKIDFEFYGRKFCMKKVIVKMVSLWSCQMIQTLQNVFFWKALDFGVFLKGYFS